MQAHTAVAAVALESLPLNPVTEVSCDAWRWSMVVAVL